MLYILAVTLTTEVIILSDNHIVVTYGFCLNSRRWLYGMSENPAGCPYGRNGWEHCDVGRCGYYEAREASRWLKGKLRLLAEISEWHEMVDEG